MKTYTNRWQTKIVNELVSRIDDLFDVTHVDLIKLFDVQQQLLISEKEKEREEWIE